MNAEIILTVIFFGLALSMDSFAISVSDGLTYTDLNRHRRHLIAFIFAFMHALMPLIGYWIIDGIEFAVAQYAKEAVKITCKVLSWVAFVLLVGVGLKMGAEGIYGVTHPEYQPKKKFSLKEVLLFGLITSIDALAIGFSLHSNDISTSTTIWLHVAILFVIVFIICCLGIFLGNFFNRLLHGKYEISEIFGGAILIILAIWIVVSHYITF